MSQPKDDSMVIHKSDWAHNNLRVNSLVSKDPISRSNKVPKWRMKVGMPVHHSNIGHDSLTEFNTTTFPHTKKRKICYLQIDTELNRNAWGSKPEAN